MTLSFKDYKCLDYNKNNPTNSFPTNGQQWSTDLHHPIKFCKRNKFFCHIKSFKTIIFQIQYDKMIFYIFTHLQT